MTERDKEVIKAFEKYIDDFDKNGLAIYDNIVDKLTLDIIRRQQSEIECLKQKINHLEKDIYAYKLLYIGAESETIKDYVENLCRSEELK